MTLTPEVTIVNLRAPSRLSITLSHRSEESSEICKSGICAMQRCCDLPWSRPIINQDRLQTLIPGYRSLS